MFFDNKEYSKAIDEFKQAEPFSFKDQAVIYNIALAYFRLEYYSLAITYYEKLLKYQQQGFSNRKLPLTDVYYHLGVAYLKQTDTHNAIIYLEKMLEHYPNDAKINALLGKAYLTQADKEKDVQAFKKAQAYMEKSVQIDPSLPEKQILEKMKEIWAEENFNNVP